MSTGKPATKRKEGFFVRIVADGNPTFFNATEHLGKRMPFTQPKATCAMRATGEAVVFSLLHTTKTSAPKIAEAPIALPRGPLEVLERRAKQLAKGEEASTKTAEDGSAVETPAVAPLSADELVVEMDDTVHRLQLIREDSGLVRLESADDDVTFQVPRQAVRLRCYLLSPRVSRPIGVGFIGHLGKPDTTETVARAAAMVLNSMSGLYEFNLLSGIETVAVPPAPARSAPRFVRKAEDRVTFALSVNLFSDGDTPQPMGAGLVNVEVDLEHANSNQGRLLYHITPAKELAEVFEPYKTIVGDTIHHFIGTHLGGDELKEITAEIVLGEVDSGTLGRLREAAQTIPPLMFTPQRYRVAA